MCVGLAAVLLHPGAARAAACSDDAPCPAYFECAAGVCQEAPIECSATCPVPFLSCGPTGTMGGSVMSEPVPSDFRCNWAAGTCEDGSPCRENFECVPCEPPERNSSCSRDECLPSRLPCQSHDECPEFFHCYDFGADEVPAYWPPGAGRACKPLLGTLYGPRSLLGGTLLESAGLLPPDGSAGSSAASPDATGARESSGCGCRLHYANTGSAWLALALALAGTALGRRRLRSC